MKHKLHEGMISAAYHHHPKHCWTCRRFLVHERTGLVLGPIHAQEVMGALVLIFVLDLVHLHRNALIKSYNNISMN